MPGDDTFQLLLKKRASDRGFRASILLFLILTLLTSIAVWSAYAEIDDVTRAEGRIVPGSNLQVVQAPEAGSVEQVFVREGDIVDVGDLLIQMDRTRFAGQLDQEQQQAYALQARLIRLQSEIDGSELVFPMDLKMKAPGFVASESSLLAARRTELETQVQVLMLQAEQQREALSEAEELLKLAESTLALVNEQIKTIEPLVERGLEPKTSLIRTQIEVREWQGQLAQTSSRILREQSRLRETEQRIVALQSQFKSSALEDFSHTNNELASLAPSIPVLEQRVEQTNIESPIHGVVNQVFFSHTGAIVPTGADLIEIVPHADELLVEAFVAPADIAFLYVGQSVNVKITAYDFSRYGALVGEIVRIGASPVAHPERDYNVFTVEVVTSTKLTDSVGEPLPIVPGMIAEVEFVSEKKSVLEYITQPVVRVRERAFRD